MEKLDKSKDMRMIILSYLYDNDFGLEQHIANPFLSTLKTTKGKGDVGTIKRSLRDLEKAGFIQETNEAYEVLYSDAMDTRGGGKTPDHANPLRFVQPVGSAPQIGELFLGITTEGSDFLTKRNLNLNIDALNREQLKAVRNQNKVFSWIVGSTIAVAITSIANIWFLSTDSTSEEIKLIRETIQNSKPEQSISQPQGETVLLPDTTSVISP